MTANRNAAFSWVGIKTAILHDYRVGQLSEAAHRLFVASLLKVGEQRTGGEFPRCAPEPKAMAWAAGVQGDHERPTDELVEAQLWVEDDGTWFVLNLADFIHTPEATHDPVATGRRGGLTKAHPKHVKEGRREPGCMKCDEGDVSGTPPQPEQEPTDDTVIRVEECQEVIEGFLHDFPDDPARGLATARARLLEAGLPKDVVEEALQRFERAPA